MEKERTALTSFRAHLKAGKLMCKLDADDAIRPCATTTPKRWSLEVDFFAISVAVVVVVSLLLFNCITTIRKRFDLELESCFFDPIAN